MSRIERVYISGPISDRPQGNKPAFDAEEARLRSAGVDVFNPQSIAPPPDGMSKEEVWKYYMRHCVRELPDCTQIRLLPEWEQSKGARWEHAIADMLGLVVTYVPYKSA